MAPSKKKKDKKRITSFSILPVSFLKRLWYLINKNLSMDLGLGIGIGHRKVKSISHVLVMGLMGNS